MKLVTYEYAGQVLTGIHDNGTIYSLDAIGIKDALSFIREWTQRETEIRDFLSRKIDAVPADKVRLLAPLANPPRIFGIGLNYQEHAAESKMKVQAVPTVFLKLPSSIIGPGDMIPLPENATQPDYEAELAIVIGRPGYRIAEQDWQEHVIGYTILNDVSARGVQLATSQWSLGKSFPGFTPLGPWIVTADEIRDPHSLDIQLNLNGEVMQSANTRDLIFKIPALITYISSIVPLLEGDIISTGTPPGVGLGRTPPRWLLPDEDIEIKIDSIGTLLNRTSTAAA